MTKKQTWDKVGGGSYEIFKPRKQADRSVVWGWVIGIVVALLLLSSCS